MSERRRTSRQAGSRDGYPDEATRRQDGTFVRYAITTVVGVIAGLTFAFSFGNTWAVGIRLGVQPWIAPLVGPSVDLSVVGLLAGIHYAASHGVRLDRLRPARGLLAFCGMATVALNVAEPLLRRDYGQAAFEILGPILLLGWSEVAPTLLGEIHTASVAPTARATTGESNSVERSDRISSRTRSNGRRSDSDVWSDTELLERARRLDDDHRVSHGRPIPADDLRRELAIGTARARALVKIVRSGGSELRRAPAS